jgi:hypothetical protein
MNSPQCHCWWECCRGVWVLILELRISSAQKDAGRLCDKLDAHGGEVLECLRSHRTNLTWECQEQVFRKEVEDADDIRLSTHLFRNCLADKKKVRKCAGCQGPLRSQGRALAFHGAVSRVVPVRTDADLTSIVGQPSRYSSPAALMPPTSLNKAECLCIDSAPWLDKDAAGAKFRVWDPGFRVLAA